MWRNALVVCLLFPLLLLHADSRPGPSRIEMHNVNFRLDPQLVLEIARLNGKLAPAAGSDVSAVFDDPRSFILEIETAQIALSTAALAHLLNTYVFGKDSPLRELTVSVQRGKLMLKGKLHKGIALPVSILATLQATPDGKIRVHPTDIHAAKLPAKGFMDLFGIDVADLIGQSGRGVTVEKDDLILDPERMLPPPRIQGKVASVRIEGDRIVQVFGGARSRVTDPRNNYIAHHGGSLRFGKLTMREADLTLVDRDPRDPFDFFLAQYSRQLVAGYSKTLPNGGLRTYMPDYGDLRTR